MNKRVTVHLPEVPGIELDYRPRDYFWGARRKPFAGSSMSHSYACTMCRELRSTSNAGTRGRSMLPSA
jgi:hypothetical protein